MWLFGRKKKKEPKPVSHHIYGGLTYREIDSRYEINFKNPAPSSITVDKLDDRNLGHPYNIDKRVPPGVGCQLEIVEEEGKRKAYLSII